MSATARLREIIKCLFFFFFNLLEESELNYQTIWPNICSWLHTDPLWPRTWLQFLILASSVMNLTSLSCSEQQFWHKHTHTHTRTLSVRNSSFSPLVFLWLVPQEAVHPFLIISHSSWSEVLGLLNFPNNPWGVFCLFFCVCFYSNCLMRKHLHFEAIRNVSRVCLW